MTGNKLAEVTPKLEDIARKICDTVWPISAYSEVVYGAAIIAARNEITAILRPFITPASTPPYPSNVEDTTQKILSLIGNSKIAEATLQQDLPDFPNGLKAIIRPLLNSDYEQLKGKLELAEEHITDCEKEIERLLKINVATPATPTESVREGRVDEIAKRYWRDANVRSITEEILIKIAREAYQAGRASPSVPLLDVEKGKV